MWRLECFDVLNVGGWSDIYSPQPPHSYCLQSTTCGRSAPLVRTLYINGWICNGWFQQLLSHQMCRQMSNKVDVDGPVVHPDGLCGCSNSFYWTRHLRVFSGFQWANSQRLRPHSPHMASDGLHLSFERSIVEMCFWHISCSKCVEVSRMVRQNGTDDPPQVIFPKRAHVWNNLRYSEQSALEARTVCDALFWGLRFFEIFFGILKS
jgi:hypothetical protein